MFSEMFSLLMVSFIGCSLAQLTCDSANQTLHMNSDCLEALSDVFADANSNVSRNATAVMMVCESSTTCNQNISAYFDNCPFSQLNIIDVLCTTDNDRSQRCIDVLPDNDTIENILGSVSEVCFSNDSFQIGRCNSGCIMALENLTDVYGCCLLEYIQFSRNLGYSNTFYDLYLTQVPTLFCGTQNSFCNGTQRPPIGPDGCSEAFTNLFQPNDTCTVLIRRMFMGDISAVVQFNTASADCPTRFQNFIAGCSEIYGERLPIRLIQLIEGSFLLAAATNNGQSCAMSIPRFLTLETHFQGQACIQSYFNRRCSDECRNALLSLTRKFGCCLNSFSAAFNGNDTGIDDQLEYIILAREVYTLCNVSDPGFCSGINVPFTSAAENCVSAVNQFFAQDDVCTNTYQRLGDLSSMNSVQNAAEIICASDACGNRLNSYADYLYTCRVGNLGNDDGSEDDSNDITYIRVTNITRYTTCRMRSDGTSCYPVLMFSNMRPQIDAAFDYTNSSAVCLSAFNGGECANECRQLLIQALSHIGCCIAEYGNALLGSTSLAEVARSCQVPNITHRCPEITAQSVDRCTRAQAVLVDNATCGDAFNEFLNAYFHEDSIIIATVEDSLNQICQQETCMAAVSEYLDACEDIGTSFGDNYEELRKQFDGFACRQSDGNRKGDCFLLNNTDPTIAALGGAFAGGVCSSAVNGECSSACRNTLQTAINSAGCCVGLIGNVFFKQVEPIIGAVTVDEIAQTCGVSVPGECAKTGDGGGNGSSGVAEQNKVLSVTILFFIFVAMLAI